MDHHFRFSSFREKLIEHLFVGELLKLSWQSGDCSLEVAKPEVDNSGYDVIVERDGIVRHIQLKASHRDAKAASQKVHVALGRKPSGCVVWVRFDTSTLDLGPFLFFGKKGVRFIFPAWEMHLTHFLDPFFRVVRLAYSSVK